MGNLQVKNLPYLLEEDTAQTIPGGWALLSGVRTDDHSPVSVFRFPTASLSPDDPKLQGARNCVRRLKTLRHPYILEFVEDLETDQHLYLVTEPVAPLPDFLHRLSAEEGPDRFRQEAPGLFAWGLYRTAALLHFLHASAGLRHALVSQDALFVTRGGDWKLGCFDLCAPPPSDSNTSSPSPSSSSSPTFSPASLCALATCLIHPAAAPPEGFRAGAPLHALDSWRLSQLATSLFRSHGVPLPGPDGTPLCARLAAQRPEQRPPCASLQALFGDDLVVRTCLFLDEISLKSGPEKDAFFSDLAGQLPGFPLSMRKFKLIPSLVAALDFGGANARVLGPLLKIGVELTEDEFAEMVLPSVLQWFGRSDRNMRLNLLQNLYLLEPHFSHDVVETSVFPNVAKGFSDSSPALRELSLKSLLVLVPKLQSDTVQTAVLRALAQFQTDQEADIRANTTVCIARLVRHFTQATRDRVLVPAFSRALKDASPKARAAGLRAFVATLEHYSAEKLAQRVLPEVAPLAVDQDAEVRRAALEAVGRLHGALVSADEQRRKAAEEEEAAGGVKGGGGGGAQNGGGGGGGGVLAWAVSALATKIVATPQQGESKQVEAAAPKIEKIRVPIGNSNDNNNNLNNNNNRNAESTSSTISKTSTTSKPSTTSTTIASKSNTASTRNSTSTTTTPRLNTEDQFKYEDDLFSSPFGHDSSSTSVPSPYPSTSTSGSLFSLDDSDPNAWIAAFTAPEKPKTTTPTTPQPSVPHPSSVAHSAPASHAPPVSTPAAHHHHDASHDASHDAGGWGWDDDFEDLKIPLDTVPSPPKPSTSIPKTTTSTPVDDWDDFSTPIKVSTKNLNQRRRK